MDTILQNFLQSIPYGTFMTLTFFLSLVSPIIIGNTIKKGENESRKISKGMAFIFIKTRKVSKVFTFIFDLLSNIIDSLLSKIFKYEAKKDEESFIVMVKTLTTIVIITLIYYWISSINLTIVFVGVREIIKDNLGSGISLKSILSIVIDNSLLIIPFLKVDGWYVKLFIQIIISILYFTELKKKNS